MTVMTSDRAPLPARVATTVRAEALRIGKRSVVIAGHKTSVSLEAAFWQALKAAADRRGVTINQLVTEIDRTRTGNLSSAIRVFLLQENG